MSDGGAEAAACLGLVARRIRKIFGHFRRAKIKRIIGARKRERVVVTAKRLWKSGIAERQGREQPTLSAVEQIRVRGYCSLDEDLEDCFFTAKTSFFRSAPSKTPAKNVAKTLEEEKRAPPTVQEIKQRIEKYNAKVTNCLLMKLNDDGTYTGFIKVHLKLRRPVTVPAGIRPQSIYDALKEVNLADMTDKRTSFYLPLDAIKQLHISSTTTVSEVIQGLLKKFMVVDNPQKFALFKEMRKDGQ
ncbi:PREDICTED: ras association domain-containing protein 5, partial [Tinamus guttatus]|uniref:ras association domain-containing protein 5 n=1 Tax=Tinamus guttatus TaxID=94827 RepID=UPI00052E8C0E